MPYTGQGRDADAPAESEIVELFPPTDDSDFAGPVRLLANHRWDDDEMQCGNGVKHCRYVSFSDDLGLTWANGTAMPNLPGPECKGGITRWEGGRALVEVNSANSRSRTNETVFLSQDNGRTWPKRLQVHGDAGYSTVTMVERQNTTTILDLFDCSMTCNVKVAIVTPNAIP